MLVSELREQAIEEALAPLVEEDRRSLPESPLSHWVKVQLLSAAKHLRCVSHWSSIGSIAFSLRRNKFVGVVHCLASFARS